MAAPAMQTNAPLIVKITNGTEMRRFTTDAETFTWAALRERVLTSFELGSKAFKMTYVDDEDDRITLSTDEELSDAIGLARLARPPVLRLTVLVQEVAAAAPKAARDKCARPASTAPAVAAGLAPFLETLAQQLPKAVESLPEALRKALPAYELDVAATIAANKGDTPQAGACGDPFCPSDPHAPNAKPGVHEGVTCDKSGQSPIVGNRYHLIGHNYDLCEAEFAKLSGKEQALFRLVAPPPDPGRPIAAEKPPAALGVHPGVECDRSGQCPIVGTRYHLRGANYDLCQAEYDKLTEAEKSQYEAMSPPVHPSACGPAGPGWRPGLWRARAHGWGPGGGHWGGPGPGPGHGRPTADHPSAERGGCHKLAARFVRDVTIFDGTQMAPGTRFTKIWRIKNIGEVPWPAGTKMLFVGGDQMTTEMAVPLAREMPVMPNEEVDVAVEMTAPAEHGRYLGYWRLTGPRERRKFGQRVWCHVQVVDPSAPPSAPDDFQATLAEIQEKKSALTATDPDPDPDTDTADLADGAPPTTTPLATPVVTGAPSAMATATATATAMARPVEAMATATATATATSDVASVVATAIPAPPPADPPPQEKQTESETAAEMSDDGVLVTEGMLQEALPDAVAGPSGAPPAPAAAGGTKGMLVSMGFADGSMIDAVLAKNGDDIDACVRDLSAAAEWDPLIDDLCEMGFGDVELNKSLLLKHNGNIKRAVKDLVEFPHGERA